MSRREEFSWRMLFAALVLIVVGVLLMTQSANMLFEMNPLSIFFIGLAAVFIFSGIILIVVAVAALAYV